jgi:twitching motility protein PilT
MIATSAIRNLIREGKAHQMTSIIQTSASVGMQTMDQCLRDLYMRGVIAFEMALARCQNEEELRKMIATTTGGVAQS